MGNRKRKPAFRGKTLDKRIGLVGFGLGGARFHAPLISAAEGLELAAIVTSDAGRAGEASARFPGAKVVANVDSLADLAVDCVVVATPNRHHVEIASRFLGLGVPVVVDKPLAIGAEAAAGLVAVAEASSVPLTVFQNRRWDGDFLTVRQLVDAGRLGEVVRFESRFDKWAPEPTGRARESGDPADGGGLLLDLGSHLIDQAIELFGPVETVLAQLEAVVGDADDDDTLLLRHQAGVVSQLGMSVLGSMPVRRFTVTGSTGSYVKRGLDVQEGQLARGVIPGDAVWGVEEETLWGHVWKGSGKAVPEPTTRGAYEAFYAGVREMLDGAAPPVDPADAVRGLAVIDAARISSAEGRAVTVSES